MNILLTGAAGYIGGSVAAALLAEGHQVTGLVRSEASAAAIAARGLTPLRGTLDDHELLIAAATRADAVINCANADHEGAVLAFTVALANSGKPFLHTSGSSVVGTQAGGERTEDVFDEATPFTPSPGRAARAALNAGLRARAAHGFRPVILCPSLIYGLGHGATAHSMQVPWLIATARKHGAALHYGPGENIWSNVHIDDLVRLYLLALRAAPPGSFYFAENGENSMRELCQAISRMLGLGGGTRAMSREEAVAEWGENGAVNTMGSNSRVRAVAARRELGWAPSAPSVVEEIELGCYREG